MKFLSTLFLFALFSHAVIATEGCYCNWWDPRTWGCCFSQLFNQAFNALKDAVLGGLEAAFRKIVEGIASPALKIGVALPTFENFSIAKLRTYIVTALGDAMVRVYNIAMLVAYGIVGVALMLSGFWVLGESMDLMRQGEGMSTLRRVVLVAALIPLARYVYDYAALGIAYANSLIAPPATVATLVGAAGGVSLGAALGIALLGGWIIFGVFALIGFVLLVLGALRLMLVAVLASLLPVALALTLIPLSFVRNVGFAMVSTLTNLMLATLMCSAIYRFGAAIASSIPSIFGKDVIEALMSFVILFACMLAPAISLVLAPRASIGIWLASYFLGTVAKPVATQVARQVAPTIRAGLGAVGSYLEHAATSRGPLAWVSRVVRAGATLYRWSKQPGGVYGYATSRIIGAYRVWRARVEHPEESADVE